MNYFEKPVTDEQEPSPSDERRYYFTVTLCGVGENECEAWEDAVSAFCSDPGEPGVYTEEEIEEED